MEKVTHLHMVQCRMVKTQRALEVFVSVYRRGSLLVPHISYEEGERTVCCEILLFLLYQVEKQLKQKSMTWQE